MTDGRSIPAFLTIRSLVKVWETIDIVTVSTISKKKGGMLEQRHRFDGIATATPGKIQQILKRQTEKAIRWIETDNETGDMIEKTDAIRVRK